MGVSEYSLVLSTDTMLVSSSLVMRTIQFSICVTWKAREEEGGRKGGKEGRREEVREGGREGGKGEGGKERITWTW